jgi:hypothetical protein
VLQLSFNGTIFKIIRSISQPMKCKPLGSCKIFFSQIIVYFSLMYHTLDKLQINFVVDETSTNIEGGGGGGFSSIAKNDHCHL